MLLVMKHEQTDDGRERSPTLVYISHLEQTGIEKNLSDVLLRLKKDGYTAE